MIRPTILSKTAVIKFCIKRRIIGRTINLLLRREGVGQAYNVHWHRRVVRARDLSELTPSLINYLVVFPYNKAQDHKLSGFNINSEKSIG
jgi:hypothetical protein